jgi:hypothetical protein
MAGADDKTDPGSQSVYQGTECSCKVDHLLANYLINQSQNAEGKIKDSGLL